MADESFVCNICLSNLSITRFKCTCCVDFDVCEECLEAADATHQNHIFLKIYMEKSVDHVPVQNQEPGLAEQLAVLDGVQYFSLDEETISKQLHIPKEVIRWTVASILQQLAEDQQAELDELCPGLADKSLNTDRLQNEDDSSSVGLSDHRGADALALWDCVEGVAFDDDVNSAVDFSMIESWIEMQHHVKSFNLMSLLRVVNLGGKLSREPSLQKKVLKLAEVVVQGNHRVTSLKRKNLQQALKKQSRSRTKTALENIVSYATVTHFAPEAAPAADTRTTKRSDDNNARRKHSQASKTKSHKKQRKSHKSRRRTRTATPERAAPGDLSKSSTDATLVLETNIGIAGLKSSAAAEMELITLDEHQNESESGSESGSKSESRSKSEDEGESMEVDAVEADPEMQLLCDNKILMCQALRHGPVDVQALPPTTHKRKFLKRNWVSASQPAAILAPHHSKSRRTEGRSTRRAVLCDDDSSDTSDSFSDDDDDEREKEAEIARDLLLPSDRRATRSMRNAATKVITQFCSASAPRSLADYRQVAFHSGSSSESERQGWLSPHELTLVRTQDLFEWCHSSSDSDAGSAVDLGSEQKQKHATASHTAASTLSEGSDSSGSQQDSPQPVSLALHLTDTEESVIENHRLVLAAGEDLGSTTCVSTSDECLLILYDPSILACLWKHRVGAFVYYAPNLVALTDALLVHLDTTFVLYQSLTMPVNVTTHVLNHGSRSPVLQPVSPSTGSYPSPCRSILKKRRWSQAEDNIDTKANHDYEHSHERDLKKSVSFDLTASMHYKRWRCGKAPAFSVQAALQEADAITTASVKGTSSNTSISRHFYTTNDLLEDDHSCVLDASVASVPPPPLLLPPSQLQQEDCYTLAGTVTPPPLPQAPPPTSILHKRSRDENSANEPASDLSSEQPSEQPSSKTKAAKKAVTFSPEVGDESKPRRGPYMSYKKRVAERAARFAEAKHCLLHTAAPPAVSVSPSTSVSTSSSGFSTAYDLVTNNLSNLSNLGSFWQDFQTPSYASRSLPALSAPRIVGTGNSTSSSSTSSASSSDLTTETSPHGTSSVSNGNVTNFVLSSMSAGGDSSKKAWRYQVHPPQRRVEGSLHESDTESDSSVELDIGAHVSLAPAGPSAAPTAEKSSPGLLDDQDGDGAGDEWTERQNYDFSGPHHHQHYQSSGSSRDHQTVSPCALSSTYTEFYDSVDENVDTSNHHEDADEDSPFFDDEPFYYL